MKINAHGGFVVREGAPNVRLDVAEVELELEAVIDDVTDSSSGGVATGLPCLVKVQSLSISVAEDTDAYPEILGLSTGAVISLFLRRGSLAQWDYVYRTIVKTYRKVNDNNGKARRISLTCEYGTYFHNVDAPSGFEA